MIAPRIVSDEDSIRHLLLSYGHLLEKEMQEIKITPTVTGFTLPMVCVLRGYEPPGNDTYSDALFVNCGGDEVHIFSLPHIASLEVLPTRRMTPRLAYEQMKEMEKAAGV